MLEGPRLGKNGDMYAKMDVWAGHIVLFRDVVGTLVVELVTLGSGLCGDDGACGGTSVVALGCS